LSSSLAAVTVRDPLFSPRTTGRHRPGPRPPAPNREPRPPAPAARCPHDGFHAVAVLERRPRTRATDYRSGAAAGEPPRPPDTATTQCGSFGLSHSTSRQPAPQRLRPPRSTTSAKRTRHRPVPAQRRNRTPTAAGSQHQRVGKSGTIRRLRGPGRGPDAFTLLTVFTPRSGNCSAPSTTGSPELSAVGRRPPCAACATDR